MNNTKKNICFFNTNTEFGGGEKWHVETADFLVKSGYNVTFITNKKSKYLKILEGYNFKIIPITLSNYSFINPFKILYVYYILKKENIDSIIINLPSDLKVAGIAARLASVRKIIYRRGSAIHVRRTFLNKLLLTKVVTCIVVNSEETKRTILSGFPELKDAQKISIIYNGLDINAYDNQTINRNILSETNDIIIGNAGRMVNQKNQSDLLHIAKILIDRNLKFRLVIAGEGELKSQLKSLAENLGITDYVYFAGYIKNIRSLMERIDIFALTSHWEGFGFVLSEAMASEKPVVAYNISSNPEIVANNQTGFLVNKDNIEEFADRLEELIIDKNKRTAFGIEGRKIVEQKFNFQKNINQLINLLK